MSDVVVVLCLSRELLDELLLEFVMLINVLMFRVLVHKCGFGCTCANLENPIKRIATLVVRLAFFRKPERPELKERSAVGSVVVHCVCNVRSWKL